MLSFSVRFFFPILLSIFPFYFCNYAYFIDFILILTLINYLFPAVGGLGLNLTSADTLVFMEHDWNPMRDHQVQILWCFLFAFGIFVGYEY